MQIRTNAFYINLLEWNFYRANVIIKIPLPADSITWVSFYPGNSYVPLGMALGDDEEILYTLEWDYQHIYLKATITENGGI